MQLAFLGKAEKTRAPTVFEGWISDRDFADPTKRTVDVRVLLTKNQLSDLEMILNKIVDAADRGVLEPNRFFDSLRSIAAQYGRDPNLATRPEATRLADLGILGEYLEGLPYQSDVMNLDQDTWSRWGPQRQYDFINRLKAKIRLYGRYNADLGRWKALAAGSPVDEHVYPVRLLDLP
jgi:plasmid stabilization system protein ParE